MILIEKNKDQVYFVDNFIDDKECKYWISFSKNISKNVREKYEHTVNELWKYRTVNITQSNIVNKVEEYINKKLKLNLKIKEAELQNWIVNSSSELHTHVNEFRKDTNYNSMLYLNDDFLGGEFYTESGIVLKPKKGMLTLFNGATVKHGVKKVLEKDRYSIIFWWK